MTLQINTLITGASSELAATVLAFAQAGIDVALVSRSRKIEAVVSAAFETGVSESLSLDLAQIEQVKRISSIAADLGPIDILVNNAGMGYTGSLSKTPLSDWLQVNLNLTSVFQCSLGILPMMRSRKRHNYQRCFCCPFPNWEPTC